MPAHHDDGAAKQVVGAELLEERHAVRVGHPDVQQDQVDLVRADDFAGLGGVFSREDGVAFLLQDLREQIPDAEFVVYN